MSRYFTQNHKCRPHGGTRWNKGLSKVRHIIWKPWTTVENLVPINAKVTKMVDQLTDISVFRSVSLARLKKLTEERCHRCFCLKHTLVVYRLPNIQYCSIFTSKEMFGLLETILMNISAKLQNVPWQPSITTEIWFTVMWLYDLVTQSTLSKFRAHCGFVLILYYNV